MKGVELAPYKLTIDISPSDAQNITLGQKTNILVNDKEITGTVKSIGQTVDYTTGTSQVVIFIDNPEAIKLRPGIIAQVVFSMNQHMGFIVDKKIVKNRNKKDYIRVVGADQKIKMIEVRIIDSILNKIEIKNKDLNENLNIITKSTTEPLMDRQKVEIIKK